MKKKVIIVLAEAPLPYAGAASRWYYTLATLLGQGEYDVELFASCASAEHVEQARALFPHGHFYLYQQGGSLGKKLRSLLRPFSYIISDEMKRDFEGSLKRGYDLIHIEQVNASWILDSVPARAFVSVHYLSAIDLKSVHFSSLKESLLMALKKRSEKKLLSRFKHIKSCSERIQKEIQSWFPEKHYTHFPFGIDLSQYRFLPDNERGDSNVIVLIASMNWYPGKSAAIRLLTQLWPELKKRNPSMQLRIVGWQARSELKEFLEMPGVEILENVPDIKKYFYESALLVYAPSQGSGVKIKIQEAMLLGTPVVSNEEGVEGLKAQHGVHALLSNNNQQLIELIETLFHDKQKQNELRRQARLLIEQTCSGEVVVNEMKRYYETIMSGS